ncbi:AfsR/SARP family transcriptional regulator [Actinokineospora sp. UTMC 2448]|uniref:AfsR/SARP family transcriptional regulator n=1 Tax=Actinokineospora sp. UTMC 2448 TaxID=2268449 RepID=UPI002164D3A7|nr:AfsR/SARP family transcriptional regulator [Actinokineospora sp. UTMC 2448]UVS78734.1 Molybdopterin biosynthesis positive regulator [Actinokineospora sp. UTMC 2448]
MTLADRLRGGIDHGASAGGLRFNVLGFLEILRDGRPCPPMPPKQRALVAILLLHANQVLTTDVIIDLLWSTRPPRSAAAALQMHVSGARRALTGASADPRRHPVLRTESHGYAIRLGRGQLDLSEFRSLARAGNERLAEGRCAEAGAAFDSALGLWRGRAVADIAGVLDSYTVHLDEQRLTVLQQRVSVGLCQGRVLSILDELVELCARHPLREDLHQQLMVAFARLGRTADALRAYTRLRRTMIAEAGLEPGPAVRAAHDAVLRGAHPADPVHTCVARGFDAARRDAPIGGARR